MTRFLFCCKNTRSATGIRGLDTHAPAVKVVSMTPSQTSLQDSPRVAQVIAAELARHVTDVVVCPGSRNAQRRILGFGYGAGAAPRGAGSDDVGHCGG